MPNSSSSKYVKRRAHRRTKSRRHAKKYTVKKVMRGCSSKQCGGAQPLASSTVDNNTIPVHVGPGTPPQQAATNVAAATAYAKMATLTTGVGSSEAYTPTVQPITAPAGVNGSSAQKGGYKSKHRRRRYKKSIGRKGRSRRFRGSRK
jgi:hypothetical protein